MFSYREAVSAQNDALKYGSDFHVNECQKIRHHRGSNNAKDTQIARANTSAYPI